MPVILGVRVDNISRDEAAELSRAYLKDTAQHTIFTPNPEMLVAAQRNEAFRDALNQGSLNLCDGTGLRMVSSLSHRVQGTDFVETLCQIAVEGKKNVYLLGTGDESVLQNARANLLVKFPHLEIVGSHAGPEIDNHGTGDSQSVIDDINRRKPDILFVAFGHTKQELWIQHHLPQLPSVQIAMGVGGALDFISGKIKRAPKWMQMLGIEWAYRLIQQPKRFKRIFTAVIIFPILWARSRSKT
jgi:N-acetylglucosaminyldiphosphoundecaprenol N-acetyl-beta-D-mannosaminyltransferase